VNDTGIDAGMLE